MELPVTAPEKAPQKTNKAQPVRRPFITGTRRIDSATYDKTKTLTAGTQSLDNYECDAEGFMSGLYILVEGNITVTATGVVVYGSEAPFGILDTIELQDTNSKAILGPMTGYELYLCNKYGGYSFNDDARNNADTFLLTAGSAADFAFVLRLPIEIVHRDALGSLPNKSSSATYTLKMRVGAYGVGSVFNAVGLQTIEVRVRVQQFGWMDPEMTDIQGNAVQGTPPANGATQIWETQAYGGLASGNMNVRLTGLDTMIRNLIFVLRDNSASSATAASSATSSAAQRHSGDLSFPDPFTLQYEKSTPISRMKTIWRHMIGEWFEYAAARGAASTEAAKARDLGVYPEPFNTDFGHKPGAESRFGYMPSNSATSWRASGSIPASLGTAPYTLTVISNKISPPEGNVRALAGR